MSRRGLHRNLSDCPGSGDGMEVCLQDNSLKGTYKLQELVHPDYPQAWADKCPEASVQLSAEWCFWKNSSQKVKTCLQWWWRQRRAMGWGHGLNKRGGGERIK